MNTFVKRNPAIGYCQGVNFIANMLLDFLDEEQSFWIFTIISEELLPIDYYSDLLGVLVDSKVFENLLILRYPKVVK